LGAANPCIEHFGTSSSACLLLINAQMTLTIKWNDKKHRFLQVVEVRCVTFKNGHDWGKDSLHNGKGYARTNRDRRLQE
jgi:hypothetical protein